MAGSERDPRMEAVRSALDFATLDDETIGRLIDRSEPRRFPAGSLVFEKGSPADGLYIVVSGRVRIFDAIHGREVEIAGIEPGDFFGEISLALHTERTRSARARDDTEVLFVPARVFTDLSESHPTLAAQLLDVFAERMAAREGATD